MNKDTATRQYGPALEKSYRFLMWLIPTLDKFPKSQRFLLGDRIESTALDMLEGLIEATYTRSRSVQGRIGCARVRSGPAMMSGPSDWVAKRRRASWVLCRRAPLSLRLAMTGRRAWLSATTDAPRFPENPCATGIDCGVLLAPRPCFV